MDNSPIKDQLNIETVMPKVDEEDEESDEDSISVVGKKKGKKSSKRLVLQTSMQIDSKKESNIDLISQLPKGIHVE